MLDGKDTTSHFNLRERRVLDMHMQGDAGDGGLLTNNRLPPFLRAGN